MWAHTMSRDGISEGLRVDLAVDHGGEQRRVDLDRSDGQTVLRLRHESCRLTFAFSGIIRGEQ